MISLGFMAIFLHSLVCTTGLAIIQIFSRRTRINLVFNLPFAWGLGVAVVYVCGSMLVISEFFVTFWHWILLSILVLLSVIGAVLHIKSSTRQTLIAGKVSFDVVDLLVLIALLTKVCLITYIAFVNPIIDSDAGSTKGYFTITRGLVERIPFSDILQNHLSELHSAISPPILSAWSAMFFDRWYISFASMPWLFSYLALLGVVFVTTMQTTQKPSLALICVWMYSSVFLLVVHTIRPGYHDALVAYFFTCQMSLMTLLIVNKIKFNSSWLILVAGTLTGLYLSKIGGKLFSVLILGFWINYFLNHYSNINTKTLFRIQAEFVIVFTFSYLILHKNVIAPALAEISVTDIFSTLIPRSPHKLALTRFRNHLYEWSSFGMLWWVASILYVLAWVRRNTTWEKLLLLFVGFLYLCTFYVCNFTEHAWVEFATTTGRFGLQVIGLALPCYCLFFAQKQNSISHEKLSTDQ